MCRLSIIGDRTSISEIPDRLLDIPDRTIYIPVDWISDDSSVDTRTEYDLLLLILQDDRLSCR